MLKMMGLICMILFFAGVGNLLAGGLAARAKNLRTMEDFLRALAVEMSARYTSPAESIAILTDQPAFSCLDMMKECVRLLQEGTAFPKAWEQCCGKTWGGLTVEEMSWISRLGSVLGQTDLSMELTQIDQTCSRLHQSMEQAAEKSRSQGNAYRTVGILAGTMVAIVFI